MSRAASPRSRYPLRLEHLERRDAPATLVGLNKVTYQDIDGDTVAVTFSKPILAVANVDAVFGAGFVTGDNATKQQLRQIDLTGIGAPAAGTTIQLTATRSATTGGDGFAALGHINATGIDLAAVTIDGDLGRIQAGDATTTTSGLKGLTVRSLGRFGTSTGAPDLQSGISGMLGSLTVKADVKVASIFGGQIGRVFIGGSLIGVGVGQPQIFTGGDMGFVTIRGNLTESSVRSNGKLSGVTIGGSMQSVDIRARNELGAVLIKGSLIGTASRPSVISAGGKAVPTATADVAIGSVRVLGRVEFAMILAGDANEVLGETKNADAQIGTVFVGGDWIASSIAAGADSGNGFYGDASDRKVQGNLNIPKDVATVSSKIASVTIGGLILGTVGGSDHFGIVAENVGVVTVGGVKFPTLTGNGNDDFPIGITGDFKVNEI